MSRLAMWEIRVWLFPMSEKQKRADLLLTNCQMSGVAITVYPAHVPYVH